MGQSDTLELLKSIWAMKPKDLVILNSQREVIFSEVNLVSLDNGVAHDGTVKTFVTFIARDGFSFDDEMSYCLLQFGARQIPLPPINIDYDGRVIENLTLGDGTVVGHRSESWAEISCVFDGAGEIEDPFLLFPSFNDKKNEAEEEDQGGYDNRFELFEFEDDE